MRNYIFSISLLFVLLAPFAGSYSWLYVQKRMVRKQFKKQLIAGIDDSELVKLKFSHADAANLLRWEHAKEFEFNGEMYDVVKTITSSDSVTYIVWWDNDETVLNKKLSVLVENGLAQIPQKKGSQRQFTDFFKVVFDVHPGGISHEPSSISWSFPPEKLIFYTNLNSPPPSPPPELML